MNAKRHAGQSLSALAACCGLILVLGFTTAAFVAPPPPPLADDGEEAFRQNCAECHGVRVAEIPATTTDKSKKGPDLTGIGEKYQPEWIKKYVKTEADRDGKSHKKKFKGSDEELQVLVDWLLEQKAEDDDE